MEDILLNTMEVRPFSGSSAVKVTLPRMISLNLSGVRGHGMYVERICESFPNLEELYIHGIYFDDNSSVHISALKKLKVLQISWLHSAYNCMMRLHSSSQDETPPIISGLMRAF